MNNSNIQSQLVYKNVVISSTDRSLNLPLIPESFVRKYVQLQGNISEIMVEIWDNDENSDLIATLNKSRAGEVKVRKDNTIIITKVEEKLYTKEEVIDVCYKYKEHILDIRNNGRTISESEWFQQNLG